MTVVELAQMLDVSVSVVQKALASLIEKGLVETTLPADECDDN
ncbi:MarR family transcriptional regulator [Shewanella xiamenensis]|nr:MarR family transcriptional regulator [Shewanella xiamenensis]